MKSLPNKITFHRNYLWLMGIVTTIPGMLDGRYWPWTAGAGAVIIIWLLWCRKYRNLFIYLLAALLGAASGGWAAYRHHQILRPRKLCNVNVHIDDANALGPSRNPAYRVNAGISEGVLKDKTVTLYFPRRTPNPGVGDGENYVIDGTFRPAPVAEEYFYYDEDLTPRRADKRFRNDGFKHYQAARDIAGTVTIRAIAPLTAQAPPLMLKIRQKILHKLESNISDPDQQSLLAAIVMGFRSRLPRELKNRFTATGTAHPFSVSGLHIGVLSALLLLVLRPLPTAWHILVFILLGCYVWATGSNAPALRAAGLLLAVLFLRSRLLEIRTMELLSLIAAVMLLFNPYFIADAGFQYSFVITALLIATAPLAGAIGSLAAGKHITLGEPPPWAIFRGIIRSYIASAIVFAGVAALGSMVLSLFHQGYSFAGAILINLLIIPVLMPLFLLSVLKIIIPGGEKIFNYGLELILNYLKWCLEFFADSMPPPALALPEAVSTAVFCILLFAALAYFEHKLGLAAWIGVLGWIALHWMLPCQQADEIAVIISGGEIKQPMLAILHPASRTMNVQDAPRNGVYILLNTARHFGIRDLKRLEFSHPVAANSSGVEYLLQHFTPQTAAIPPIPIRSQVFRKNTAGLQLARTAAKHHLNAPYSHKNIAVELLPSGEWQVMAAGKKLFTIPRTAVIRCTIIDLQSVKSLITAR